MAHAVAWQRPGFGHAGLLAQARQSVVFTEDCDHRAFIEIFPSRVDEYEELLTNKTTDSSFRILRGSREGFTNPGDLVTPLGRKTRIP